MHREYKEEKYLGLFFSIIPEDKIKIDVKLNHGDIIENSKGLLLWYAGSGFKLVTNNSRHYITEEDLEEKFKL